MTGPERNSSGVADSSTPSFFAAVSAFIVCSSAMPATVPSGPMAEALTIGVVTGVTPDKWVRVWRERMPRVPLHVQPVDEDRAVAALGTGVDLVFVRLPLTDPDDLHVIPLWEESPVVVAGRDHPVKAFDAVALTDLADEEQHPGWSDEVLDLVAAGHGVARMPQSVFRAIGRRDLVARPITDAATTRIGLVWRREAGGPLVDEFIGIVRGRTANSSRSEDAPAPAPSKRAAGRPERRGRASRPSRRR